MASSVDIVVDVTNMFKVTHVECLEFDCKYHITKSIPDNLGYCGLKAITIGLDGVCSDYEREEKSDG